MLHKSRGASEGATEPYGKPEPEAGTGTCNLRSAQAHFNAFVPPASVDWMAYEWRPGDFVRHFAGCPWQERGRGSAQLAVVF